MNYFKYFFIIFYSVFLTGCSKTELPKSFSYKENLENLIFKFTNLDQLSKYTGIDKNVLVGIAFDQYETNEDLNVALYDLLNEFIEDKPDALETLNENSNILDNISIPKSSSSTLSIEDFKNQESIKHTQFQDTLHSTIVETILNRKQGFLDSKFSVWKILPMIWERIKYNEEEILKKWNSDLNSILDFPELNMQLQNQINSYSDYINVSRRINGINKEFKAPIMNIDEYASTSEKTLEESIVNRLNNEIYSTVFSTVIELMIGLFVTLVANYYLNKTIQKNIDNLNALNKGVWGNKNKGFLSKVVVSGIATVGTLFSNNEIEKKYKRKKKYINIITTIIFLIGPFILFDYQSSKLEVKIDQIISKSIVEYLQNQNTEILNDLTFQTNNL
ncbi:hypothetical protein [Sphingobacterium sp. UBA6645]|uniref:hypothetical protein n=1 Tax=Sphingobacterium sp. UBA6645 TaxID=1947511 RepID=UPI0025FD4F96|nr:hypothetical protein [Sphingobacterium sp. UBA6645]